MNSRGNKLRKSVDQLRQKHISQHIEEAPQNINKIKRNFLGMLIRKKIVSDTQVIKTIPIWLFIAFLSIIYITNRHFAERRVKELEKAKKELKELRWEYLTLKAELMYFTKQTEIAKRVAPMGLRESVDAPFNIIVTKDDRKE